MSTRLYVSNLPLSATEETLIMRFCKFGNVASVALEPVERAQRRGAFVEMNTRSEAQRAIAALNLSDFDGRLVSVYLALSSVPSSLPPGSLSSKTA
jgi:RNA recognition motif-containing protein